MNVLRPEIMVETMDWRPMMSSRIAAYTCRVMKMTMAHMPMRCQVCTSWLWPNSGMTQPNSVSCHEPARS